MLDFAGVKTLQAMKTGALLKYACVSGAMLGAAPKKSRAALERYGAAVGEAFQVADDLLDIEGDAVTVGKATGKDAAAHKATFVSLLGVDGARKRLKRAGCRGRKGDRIVRQRRRDLAGGGAFHRESP